MRSVKAEEFDNLCGDLIALSKQIMLRKRPEYTVGNENTLHNFDSVARKYNLTPTQVIFVYWQKHLDALASSLTNGIENSEPLEQRFADALSYLLILWVDYNRGERHE